MVLGSGNMMLGHNSVNVACRFLLQHASKDVLDRELDNNLDDGYAWLDECLSV